MWTGRKGTFRPYQPLEPQPRGAVTRRAVAQRRSRASGLTRPLAEAIRVLVWVVWILSRFPRSAAVCRKSWVFSSLPIRKVLGLCFAGGVSPPLPVGFSFVFSELSTAVVAPTTWSLLFVFYYLCVKVFQRKIWAGVKVFQRKVQSWGKGVSAWKTTLDHRYLWKNTVIGSPRSGFQMLEHARGWAIAGPFRGYC